jgi:DNA glycosylase AlkZ-like
VRTITSNHGRLSGVSVPAHRPAELAVPPPEGSVLDRRTLNRTQLARQHLLDRVALPVPAMIEHLVGLQAQVPRDPYISLWSRIRGFDPLELERLLVERRAVRMTLMRTTLHLVTARDARALRPVLQPVCERGFQSSPFRRRLEWVDMASLLAAGRALLDERPRTVAELGGLLALRWPGHDPSALAYAVRYLLPLVQPPPRGMWRRSGASRITSVGAWLGGTAEDGPGENATADDVVLRYVRAFGPATVADIRMWSGLTGVAVVLERIRPRLRTFRDDAGRVLFDVDDGTFAAPDHPAPVRFTGEYDNLFLSHADRSRITGANRWGSAYARKGAFFVGGFLAGSWRAVRTGGSASIELEPVVRIETRMRSEVDVEAADLLGFLEPDSGMRAVAWRGGQAQQAAGQD